MGNALCCLGGCFVRSGVHSAGHVVRGVGRKFPKAIQNRLRLSDATVNMAIARLLYASILFVSFLLAIFLRNDWMGLWRRLGVRATYADVCSKVFPLLDKISCAGDYMVFRVSFTCFLFFFVHAILASPLSFIPPKVRLLIQYNGLCLKLPLLVLVFAISLYIPDLFFQVFSWLCMVVSALFIGVQMLLIMDWAFDWQEAWLNRGDDDYDDEEGCCSGMTIWTWLMLFISIFFFGLGIFLFGTEIFLFATKKFGCYFNFSVIFLTFLAGIAVSILSIVVGRGILPASIIFFFAMFSILSALMSEPNDSCSRFFSSSVGSYSGGQVILTYITSIGLIFIAAFSLLRTAITTGLSASKIFSLTKKEVETVSDLRDMYSEISNDGDSEMEQDEGLVKHQSTQMFWSQLVFSFASCFMAMVLTNWNVAPSTAFFETADDEWGKSDVSWIAVIMKICGAWFMYFLFAWACIIPKIVTWRDFD